MEKPSRFFNHDTYIVYKLYSICKKVDKKKLIFKKNKLI